MTGTDYREPQSYIPAASVHHHHHHHIHYNDNKSHANQYKPRYNHQQHQQNHSLQSNGIIKDNERHLVVKKQYYDDGRYLPHETVTSDVCKICGSHLTSEHSCQQHTCEWQTTKDMSFSKHQQIQLLEAAAILVDMMKANNHDIPLSHSPRPSLVFKAATVPPLNKSQYSVRRTSESVSPPMKKVKKDVRFRNRRLSSSATYRKKERKLPTISEEGVVLSDSPLMEE